MQVDYTQVRLTREDRDELGPSMTSAFLTLAFCADEMMHVQHLLLMAMEPLPDEWVYKKVANSRTHLLLRTLNLKIYETQYSFKGFEKAMCQQKDISDEATKDLLERWSGVTSKLRESEFFVLCQAMRKHLAGHIPVREVQKWLKFIPKNSEDRFLFHETKANSVFIGCDDLVFAAFLNFHFSKFETDQTRQQIYHRFLMWIIDAANEVITAFHWTAKSVFIDRLGKNISEDASYNIEQEFVCTSEDVVLPIVMPKP